MTRTWKHSQLPDNEAPFKIATELQFISTLNFEGDRTSARAAPGRVGQLGQSIR